jgi:hypothetical protein
MGDSTVVEDEMRKIEHSYRCFDFLWMEDKGQNLHIDDKQVIVFFYVMFPSTFQRLADHIAQLETAETAAKSPRGRPKSYTVEHRLAMLLSHESIRQVYSTCGPRYVIE